MSLALTITDDNTSITYTLLPSPFNKNREIGKSEVLVVSGDIYTDYVYKKFHKAGASIGVTYKKFTFEYEWDFLSAEEYAVLEGFFNRQYELHKYPRISIPELGVDNMVARMELSDQSIVNNCGMVENVKVSFRESTQL